MTVVSQERVFQPWSKLTIVGFSPFSIDVKPKHGSPDFARDIAFQKIANRIKGAKMAGEKLSK